MHVDVNNVRKIPPHRISMNENWKFWSSIFRWYTYRVFENAPTTSSAGFFCKTKSVYLPLSKTNGHRKLQTSSAVINPHVLRDGLGLESDTYASIILVQLRPAEFTNEKNKKAVMKDPIWIKSKKAMPSPK